MQWLVLVWQARRVSFLLLCRVCEWDGLVVVLQGVCTGWSFPVLQGYVHRAGRVGANDSRSFVACLEGWVRFVRLLHVHVATCCMLLTYGCALHTVYTTPLWPASLGGEGYICVVVARLSV